MQTKICTDSIVPINALISNPCAMPMPRTSEHTTPCIHLRNRELTILFNGIKFKRQDKGEDTCADEFNTYIRPEINNLHTQFCRPCIHHYVISLFINLLISYK